MKTQVLIGAGGHAREVMFQMGKKLPMYVDDEYANQSAGIFPISELDSSIHSIMIAIGDPLTRNQIVQKLNHEFEFFTFIHPTSIIDPEAKIGHGSFIGAYSIITTNVKVGCHALLNRHCQIGHDCSIGNYLSMMPGSVISGNVTVGDHFYLGTNSSVKEGIRIIHDVKIGLNSGVTKDILEPGIYGGIPIKKLK